MKTSSAKAKGRNLQKWACEQVSKLIGIDWGYEDDKLIQPRLMGQAGIDVILRGEARAKFKFNIECKRTEKISLYADIKQAKSNATPEYPWLLIHKKNGAKPIVVMDAELFFETLRRAK